MPLTTSYDAGGESPQGPAVAASPARSDAAAAARRSDRTTTTTTTSLSASPPVEALESPETTHTPAARRDRRTHNPPSPRRSTSSPAPPPHIPATARCSSHTGSEMGTPNDSDSPKSKKTVSRGRGRRDERAFSNGRDVFSGRGTAKATPGSGCASATLPEKKVAARKTAKPVTRTMGALRQKDKEESAVGGSIRARTSHRDSGGNAKTPVSTPPSTPPSAAAAASGTGSGRPSASSNASVTTSARATAPPSARTSAVVEAFLLGMQNCLSKQELLFQRLNAKLSQIDGRSPNTSSLLRSSVSVNGDGRKVEPQQPRQPSPSPTNAMSSDYEAEAVSLRYSVGTPTETPLGPTTATSAAVDESRGPATSSPHISHDAISIASRSLPPDMERMPSFDAQAQTLPSPHTPSCSVVVVHPALVRGAVTAPPRTFLRAAEDAVSPAPPAPVATSLVTSPNYLRLDNIEATTSTSATPSTLSEQLGVLSSSASSTPPSLAQHWPVPGGPTPTAPATDAPSLLIAGAAYTYTPPASFTLDVSVCEEEKREGRAKSNDKRSAHDTASTVPARRSSAVQWEGGFTVDSAAPPPASAFNFSCGAASAGGRYPFFSDNVTPPTSSSDPSPLPILSNIRRSPSGGLLTIPAAGGATVGGVSSPGNAAGNNSFRLTTVSNAMSLLTSTDSVTLSPLSRPASAWGGSPTTYSMLSSSPGQLSRSFQHPQQQYGGINNSFNSAPAGGTPGSTRSPSGAAGRSNSSGSPRQLSAAAAASTPVATSSPYSPALFNFASPPSAAAMLSNESTFAYDGVRSPQLQTNVLSSSSSVLSGRNAATATGSGSELPVPSHMCRLAGDVISPLSASSSSPSSTQTTTSRRASAVLGRNATKVAASDSLSHYNNLSFVSVNSLDEESRASLSGQMAQHSTLSHNTSRVDQSPQMLQCFSERKTEEGDNDDLVDGSNFVAVSKQSLVSGPCSTSGAKGTAVAAPPTHRELTLSASPSIERIGCEDTEPPPHVQETEGIEQRNVVVELPRRRDASDQHDEESYATAESCEAEEERGEKEDEEAAVSTSTAAIFNPFAIPPPPPSLSELHAHQQRRRLSAAPVPTMRRPPMAPSRPGNAADNAANTLNKPTLSSDDAAAAATSENAEVRRNTSNTSSGCSAGDDRAAQQEQWLFFERQHEQTHLPACWRDSEVVVVDHVEEEDRERDEEAAVQLRLLEAELMGSWQATPSGSEIEDSQPREEDVTTATTESQRRRGSRRHSYPGSLSLSGDRDLLLYNGSAVEATGDAAENNSNKNNSGDIGSDGDEREWYDEGDVEGSYQARLAQYGRMVLLQRRRSLHAPRYRSQTTTANSSNNGVGAGRSTSPGEHVSQHQHQHQHHPPEREAEEEEAVAKKGCETSTARKAKEGRPPSSPSAASSPELQESHRLFRRGHSAPAVVSDSGSADWESLRARFDELVTIQQRVHGAERDDNNTSSTGGDEGVAGAATLSGNDHCGAATEGSGWQANYREGDYQRSSSEQQHLRSRRYRSRSFGQREPGGSTSAAVVANMLTAEDASDAENEEGDGVARSLPAALHTDISSNADHSHNDDSGTTGTATLAENSQRRTLAYQDDIQRDEEAVRAVEAEAKEDMRAAAAVPASAQIPAIEGVGADGKMGRRTEQEKAPPSPTSPALTLNSPSSTAGTEATSSGRCDAMERSHSAPPLSIHVTTKAQATDSGSTPDRQHRSGVTAVHKDPPAFLASSQPTFTVDASHATGRLAAVSSATAPAATVVPTLDLAHFRTAEDEGEEAEDGAAEMESVTTSAVTVTSGDSNEDAVRRAASVPAEDEPSDEMAAPPSRTPRLRFTHTPRGTTHPNALGRVHRVVILRSASAKTMPMNSAAAVAAAERSTDKKERGVTTSVVTKGEAPKKKTTVTMVMRPQVKKVRSGLAGKSAATAKATVKRKKAGGRTAAGLASGSPKAASSSSAEVASSVHGGAVTAADSVEDEARASLTTSPSQVEEPAESTTSGRLVNHHDAMDGGEVVEPTPLGASTVSRACLTTSPSSFSASTGATATASAVKENSRAPPAAAAAAATTSPALDFIPKAEKKPKKITNAAAAATATSAARRKSADADNEVRSSLLPRRDSGPHKSAARASHTASAPVIATTAGEGEVRRAIDSGATGGAAPESAPATTSESRALLRRLAQCKDRTRAMEERLRLNSGNFTSVSAALLTTVPATADGDDGPVVDSVASTPVRSALRSQTYHDTALSPPPLELGDAAGNAIDSAAEATVTSSVTAPLAVPEDTNATPAGAAMSSGGSHPHSNQRHVSVVEPTEGPSAPFAPGPHPAPGASGKLNTRRRLFDVRARSTSSKANSSTSSATSIAAPASGAAGTVYKRSQSTGRSSSSAVAAITTAATAATPTNSASATATSATATTAAATAAGGSSSHSHGNTTHVYKRGDSSRPLHLHATSPLPAAAALSSSTAATAVTAAVQGRRRHTVGDAPFSALSERRLRPTRMPIKS